MKCTDDYSSKYLRLQLQIVLRQNRISRPWISKPDNNKSCMALQKAFKNFNRHRKFTILQWKMSYLIDLNFARLQFFPLFFCAFVPFIWLVEMSTRRLLIFHLSQSNLRTGATFLATCLNIFLSHWPPWPSGPWWATPPRAGVV